ncbi:MAG: energy transducer TonB [Pseudomonadota bacterium]
MDAIAARDSGTARRRERAGAAAGAAALTALAGLLLILGLRAAAPMMQREAAVMIQLLPDAAPHRPVAPPEPVRRHRPQGAAAPPNLRAEPSEIVAAPPPLPVPIPVAAAPIAGAGSAPTAGAADIPGPGTGAGGEGPGRGAGGDGDGVGDGDGETPPRLRRGRLKDSDYPRAAGEAGVGGTVSVRYVVGTDGRVGDCDVTRSSGNAALDDTTCRLIRERFRFSPSRDARGRPVASVIVENHSWLVHDDPPATRRR